MRTAIVKAYALGIVTGAFLTAGITFGLAPAKADGRLSDPEIDYIVVFGASAICPVIDQHHTLAGVTGVVQAIMEDGFTADDAVDIVNTSVQEFCPRNWPLLQAIGRAARSQT